jgi:hypothetical protein
VRKREYTDAEVLAAGNDASAAITAYEKAVGARASHSPAKDVIARLKRIAEDAKRPRRERRGDVEPIVAFAAISRVWSTDPPPNQEEVIEIVGGIRNSPLAIQQSYSLIEMLVKGLVHKGEVAGRVTHERRMLAAIRKASKTMGELRRSVGQYAEFREPIAKLDKFVKQRADQANSYLDSVKREGMSRANPKTELDGPTREGLRHAAMAIRAMAPQAIYSDVELVLAAAFGIDVELVNVKNLTARRRRARP